MYFDALDGRTEVHNRDRHSHMNYHSLHTYYRSKNYVEAVVHCIMVILDSLSRALSRAGHRASGALGSARQCGSPMLPTKCCCIVVYRKVKRDLQIDNNTKTMRPYILNLGRHQAQLDTSKPSPYITHSTYSHTTQ